jgi:hypothetical protein
MYRPQSAKRLDYYCCHWRALAPILFCCSSPCRDYRILIRRKWSRARHIRWYCALNRTWWSAQRRHNRPADQGDYRLTNPDRDMAIRTSRQGECPWRPQQMHAREGEALGSGKFVMQSVASCAPTICRYRHSPYPTSSSSCSLNLLRSKTKQTAKDPASRCKIQSITQSCRREPEFNEAEPPSVGGTHEIHLSERPGSPCRVFLRVVLRANRRKLPARACHAALLLRP